jgi:CrcB protein
MLKGFLFVGIGGAAGSMARYGIGVLMGKFVSQPYPHATFLINIVGCFIIGVLFGLGNKYNIIPGNWWLVLATGFCGGFTTFSSFALENISLMRSGHSTTAFLYTVLSVMGGLILCRLGIALIK